MSRRGAIEVPARRDDALRDGLAFMTLHHPDDVATNLLTIDAWDPKAGTAEFKATAIRVERLAGGLSEGRDVRSRGQTAVRVRREAGAASRG